MRLFFSAGEASGDLHAAGVIEAVKQMAPDTDVWFLGGDKMAAAAGRKPAIHYREMAYMGFTEVVKHLPEITRNLKIAKKLIERLRPDAVVLVDYPGFNMKLAAAAHEMSIPVYYFIAPKVWAWKEWRVKALRRDVKRIISILPFEPRWFFQRGVRATYAGNPSVEEVDRQLSGAPRPVPGPDILALVPGSRLAEIRSNLPVMAEVASRHPELTPYIAAAPGIPAEVYAQITSIPLSPLPTLQLMAQARAALVTSGTASLECALAGTPQVVCYRSNGMRIAHAIMSKVLKVGHVALPNLIVGSGIVPEMLVHHCNADEVDAQLKPVLADTPARKAQLKGYALMRRVLATAEPSSRKAARIILGMED